MQPVCHVIIVHWRFGYQVTWTLSRADTSLKRTVALVLRLSALERVHRKTCAVLILKKNILLRKVLMRTQALLWIASAAKNFALGFLAALKS